MLMPEATYIVGARLESAPSLTAFFSHVGHVVFPGFNA